MKFTLRRKNGRTRYRVQIGDLVITVEFPVIS